MRLWHAARLRTHAGTREQGDAPKFGAWFRVQCLGLRVEGMPATFNYKRWAILLLTFANCHLRGGIGVENLQGSGLIAGETSRAYQESLCDLMLILFGVWF